MPAAKRRRISNRRGGALQVIDPGDRDLGNAVQTTDFGRWGIPDVFNVATGERLIVDAEGRARRLLGDCTPRPISVEADRLGIAFKAATLPMQSPKRNGVDNLSEREAEVLRLNALGFPSKEIAARMTLSAKTVDTYKGRALEKLGIKTRVEIVRYAIRRGWFMG